MALCSLNTLTPRTPHKSSGSGELPVANGGRCIVTGLVVRLWGKGNILARCLEHRSKLPSDGTLKNKDLLVRVRCR